MRFLLIILFVVSSAICTKVLPAEEHLASFGTLHTLQELTYWAQKEEEIYNVLGEWESLIEKEIELVERYLEDYEESSGKALRHAKVPADTPDQRGRIIGSSQVLGHLMTDRFVSIVDPLRFLLESPKYIEAEANVVKVLELDGLSQFLGSGQWPDSNDLVMSHSAFVNIQQLNNLRPRHISSQLKVDSNHTVQLNNLHSALLGQFALKEGLYSMGVEWIEHGMKRLKKHKSDTTISKELLQGLMNVAVQSHNRKRYQLFSQEDVDASIYNVFLHPYNPRREQISMKHYYWKQDGHQYGNDTNVDMNAFSLCQGIEFQPVKIKSRLKCYLERKKHPYFYLNPVKAEILSEHPSITQFYDVLGEHTRKEIYNSRARKFISTVVVKEGAGLELNTRTSAGTMLSEELEKRIGKITEMFTGLKVDDGIEGVQAVEYVYGRVYHPHSDVIDTNEKWAGGDSSVKIVGDRLASVLYYADVSPNLVGGLTPFCEVGIAARPVPGSAVFWINMYKNGTARTDVTHAACPPLHGNKIALNKWIRYNPNFQTFLSSLDKNE